jgi:4,5-DOPA dioxygenase extradiol
MLALEGGAWGETLAALGQELPRPRAVLVCSAHWEAPGPFRFTSARAPGVLHDFGGFPEALYRLDYPAPGDPDLAARAAGLLQGAGLEAALDPVRALDHGTWVPLRHLLPRAEVPVVQLSLPFPRAPRTILAAGRALAPLRRQGVWILGSGGIVHNLGRLDWGEAGPPQPWAAAFQDWIAGRLAAGDAASLMDWRQAPGAREAVPTTEHLDPLWQALGAGEGLSQPLFDGWQLGSLSLRSYRFA